MIRGRPTAGRAEGEEKVDEDHGSQSNFISPCCSVARPTYLAPINGLNGDGVAGSQYRRENAL